MKINAFTSIGLSALLGLVTFSAMATSQNKLDVPCTNISNLTSDPLGIDRDPNWDDQELTVGNSDKANAQKIMHELVTLAPFSSITVCNRAAFDFNIANAYMTGILIGNPKNIDNDAIQFTLGITAANTHLTVTDSYSFSSDYQFTDHPGRHLRTNELEIRKVK